MKDALAFYEAQLTKYGQELFTVTSKLQRSSTLRVLVFLGIIVGIYFIWRSLYLASLAVVPLLVWFIFLVLRHSRLRRQKALCEALIVINQRELAVANGDYFDLPDGREFKNDTHDYSYDIDMFGRGSFFQYLNRTSLSEGTEKLAQLLLANNPNAIIERQEAIQELAEMATWRQDFSARAALIKTAIPSKEVERWIATYAPKLPKNSKTLSLVFSVVSLTVLSLYFLDVVTGHLPFSLFVFGLMVAVNFIKPVNQLSALATKAQGTFEQYAVLLQKLESATFKSGLLQEQQEKIKNEKLRCSQILKQFSKLLDRLDQRNNIVIAVLGNGFFLRDVFVTKSIEDWIAENRDSVPDWFGATTFFDAYNSLGNYAFNHRGHSYPEIREQGGILEIEGGSHPLLDATSAVTSDYQLGGQEFFVVTGANMSGKSTFLRTVAYHVVMANIGLPICAQKASYHPLRLVTSMRATDSLTDDESYFFSELKRLKYIVDKLASERCLVILDEILKGTNSTDKSEGSIKFVEKLIGLGASGIIATHDLSLCTLAKGNKAVKNYYFNAAIKEGEIFFDYALQEGVCQNMNANFLMQKMGIVD